MVEESRRFFKLDFFVEIEFGDIVFLVLDFFVIIVSLVYVRMIVVYVRV